MRLAPARLSIVGVAAVLASVLSSGTVVARTWHVPGDALTIQEGITLASAGDDVLVSPGTYAEHDITLKAGIWVHSEQGPAATVVNAGGGVRGFDCVDQPQMVTLEGFTIRNGRAYGDTEEQGSGGGIRCLNSQLTLRNCTVTGCSTTMYAGGIYILNSDVDMEACQVIDCEADRNGGGIYVRWASSIRIADCDIQSNGAGNSVGGVFVAAENIEIVRCTVSGNGAWWGDGGGLVVSQGAVTIRDCLITDNGSSPSCEAQGLAIDECSGLIDGCTLADHGGRACSVIGIWGSNIQIERTIIASNEGRAVECSYDSQVDWRCSDLYRNEGGNAICGNDLGGNFSADPLFCNHDDYTLDGQSPCLPGNHPDGVDCGLIGARGQGCGSPLNGACCFADGSCFVLDQSACGEQGGNYMGNGTACEPNPCEPTRVQPTTWGRIKASYR
jgi:hypothetical protein